MNIKDKEIEKTLSNLSIEQLLDLEETIMRIVKQKIKSQKTGDWKKDFLEVSEWSHLNGQNEVKVSKWNIETF